MIVVTDVIVATWYVVIIVAQLKEHIQHLGPVSFYRNEHMCKKQIKKGQGTFEAR